MQDIDQIFTNRLPPWGPRQSPYANAQVSNILRLNGLDWAVEKQKLYLKDGTEVPDNFATVRSHDNAVLGVVGNRYHIVQNAQAMAFLDDLVANGDGTLEAAGMLSDGQYVWMVARLGEFQIAGEAYRNHLFVANSQNGQGSIVVGVCPVRVVSQSAVNLPLPLRSWKVAHVPSGANRAKEADYCLGLANICQNELVTVAERLLKTPVSAHQLGHILEEVFPQNGESQRAATLHARTVDEFRYRYMMAPDLADLRGTAWGVILAMSDFVYHRQRAVYKGNESAAMLSVIVGDAILDKTYKILEEMR